MDEMGSNQERKHFNKITEEGGTVKKTERFIDQKRRLVNKQHNKVTVWPKLIWTVSFKCSLDARSPVPK